MGDISTLDFTEPGGILRQPRISRWATRFSAFGDINIQLYDFQSVISFNKDIVKSYSLDNPYELVNGGTDNGPLHRMGSEVSEIQTATV